MSFGHRTCLKMLEACVEDADQLLFECGAIKHERYGYVQRIAIPYRVGRALRGLLLLLLLLLLWSWWCLLLVLLLLLSFPVLSCSGHFRCNSPLPAAFFARPQASPDSHRFERLKLHSPRDFMSSR